MKKWIIWEEYVKWLISFSNFFIVVFIIIVGIIIVKGIRYWFEINWKKLLVGWGGRVLGKVKYKL